MKTNEALMQAVDSLLRVAREIQQAAKSPETARPNPRAATERKPSR